MRLFLQSHEWKLSLLAFGGAIAGIWGATVPFGDWDAYVISCMIWIATYVLWLGLLLMRRLVVSLTAQPHPDTPIGAKVIIPCLFVVMVLLILTDVPCRVAFWASRDAMEKVVQESLRGEGISKPKSAGLYVVVGTKRVPGGVKLCIARARQDNTRTGFFRKLDASAPLSEIAEYKHYGGSWYLCEY